MDGYESRVLREFRAALEREIDEKTISIALGALGDFPAYKQQCGVIQGMRDALKIADDIEIKLNGDR